jgi:hypothetical protein
LNKKYHYAKDDIKKYLKMSFKDIFKFLKLLLLFKNIGYNVFKVLLGIRVIHFKLFHMFP